MTCSIVAVREYGFKLWPTVVLQCAYHGPRAAPGRQPQHTLPVILMSSRTSSPPSNTSASFTAVPAGKPLCPFKRKKETDLIIGRRNDPASIGAS